MDEKDPLEGKTLAAHKTEWFLCGATVVGFIWLYFSNIDWTWRVITSPRFLIVAGTLAVVAFIRGLLSGLGRGK